MRINGLALSLALKQRLGATQKQLIDWIILLGENQILHERESHLAFLWCPHTVDSLLKTPLQDGHFGKPETYSWSQPFFTPFSLTLYSLYSPFMAVLPPLPNPLTVRDHVEVRSVFTLTLDLWTEFYDVTIQMKSLW